MHETFGELYARLTQTAIDELTERLPSGGSVIDFGAGCGRLALPLLERGYHVTAVEPSAAMMAELRARASELPADRRARLSCVETSMAQNADGVLHDMALCVFTVVAYVLDESELVASAEGIARSLTDGGLLLIAVPRSSVFGSFECDTGQIIRSVEIDAIDDGPIYVYSEQTTVRTPDGQESYSDRFRLRRWLTREVTDVLHELGFVQHADVAERFEGLGADYLLFRLDRR